MNHKENILVGCIVVEILAAFIAFKMHLNLFSATGHSFDFFDHVQENTTDTSLTDIVFYSGVCPFGKFGAWVNMIWSIYLIRFIFIHQDDEWVSKSQLYKKVYWIQLFLLISTGGLSLLMNWPLAVRSIPFLIFQLTVTIFLSQMAQESVSQELSAQ